jgi:hypothetical protein
MKALRQFGGPLFLLVCAATASAFAIGSCAGTHPRETTGSGGGGLTGLGGTGAVAINGLTSLTISPPSASITLMAGANGMLTGPTAQFTATGIVNGASMDVTSQIGWTTDLHGVVFNQPGIATATAPGIYTVIARAGSVTANATLNVAFSGAIFDPNFNQNNNNKAVLDGTPAGQTTIAYPVDGSLFPSNLAPIYAQMTTPGTNSIARLSFQASGLDVQYYANCVQSDDTNTTATGSPDPFPGTGCYVKMPLSLTQLFIATSEKEDIKMTARVFSGSSSSLVESSSINVAWANVGLSGGIYYWSTIPNPPKVTSDGAAAQPPNYILLDKDQTNGTAIYRYDFTNGTPAPTITWTDDGGPKSTPPYQGAPAAVNNNVGKGHCIGCHSISNDGKYMALTIGGSDTTTGANLALLDIGMQALININPSASTDPNSSPTNDFTDYWKKFRVEKVATENTWGPNSDRMVSMYHSKLFLTSVNISGTTGTVTQMGAVVPSWPEYESDPFWSQDGSRLVFTSFDQPDIGMYNTDGLNGDMKRRGKIAIATADMSGIHDDAKDLVMRGSNVTSFYPCISNDSKLVVFNQSTCGTDPDVNRATADTVYGNQTCDGYDDSSATLWIVSPDGGPTTRLDRANGPAGSGNSWPRFSPDHGTFRGDTIYWVAFSSRRAYGTQVNYMPASATATKPQLWIAAVRRGEVVVGDPSWSPVWLPTQNPKQGAPQGNHVPQWVKFVVVIEG